MRWARAWSASALGVNRRSAGTSRSAYSRIRPESMSTVPSSVTAVGALTTGLIAAKSSQLRKTDSASCVNFRSMSVSEIATRRT
jgi:hypothetical protein